MVELGIHYSKEKFRRKYIMMMYNWNLKQAINDFLMPKNRWVKLGLGILIVVACGLYLWFK
jgi:hypothetical protein